MQNANGFAVPWVTLAIACAVPHRSIAPTSGEPAAAPTITSSRAKPTAPKHSEAAERPITGNSVEPAVQRIVPGSQPLRTVAPECTAADWAARSLPPLLVWGQREKGDLADVRGAEQNLFDDECTDSPSGPRVSDTVPIERDGVQIRVIAQRPAGLSRRKWPGNRCEFAIRLADGSGVPVVLGASQVPAFNTVRAVVRSGSAVWLSIGFNGYAREFPKGGNRIVAADLCQGRVIWQSQGAMSNGGLLLLGDYLVAPYGFTSERRYVFVLDARSGKLIQKLPVVENVCPSSSWAPHWVPGERCDAPGQVVGAATNPRVEDGMFLVDTNTGTAMFSFR